MDRKTPRNEGRKERRGWKKMRIERRYGRKIAKMREGRLPKNEGRKEGWKDGR